MIVIDKWNKTHCDKCGIKVNQGEGLYAEGGFYHKDTCWEVVKQEYIDDYEWDEHKTNYELEVICPYCGNVERDSWESSDDDGTNICGRCENEYTYVRNVQITYSTEPI